MTNGSQASQRALPVEVRRTAGVKKEGSYIVLLKPSVDKAAFLAWLKQQLTGNSVITHDYPADFSNSFAGLFDEESLGLLRSSADVERISEVRLMENTSWNLNRLSQRPKLAFKYAYESEALGKGVDIYIVDAPVTDALRSFHQVEFGGRAKWGWAAPGLPQIDETGHGTKVAGIAAGKRWGIAKEANLFAVKTHSRESKGGMSYIWAVSKGRTSVVNMSFGFTTPQPDIDEGIAKFTARGIHVCAAAGNDGVREGSVVDLFAPGSSVTTATIGSNTALDDMSGTSAACPHVAGLAAAFVSYFGDTSAAKIKELIINAATPNALDDIPEGTPNLLTYNLCR
ncbi:subtilisin-like protein [Pilatotrama ljubarskyi]|nr:subtilisin-like protein [Pilatotrama ljubarskyi]